MLLPFRYREKKKNIWRERLYFDASKVPALTFSLHSLSWFFRVMQLEPALICSRRFLLFLRTKEHINLVESSDISLQHLDVAVLHHPSCKIVFPHCRQGQQEWGSEKMTAYTCGKYRESNHFIMMGVMWDECHKIFEHREAPTFPSNNAWILDTMLSTTKTLKQSEQNKKTIGKWFIYRVSQRLQLFLKSLDWVSWENNAAFIQNVMLLVHLCCYYPIYNTIYCCFDTLWIIII